MMTVPHHNNKPKISSPSGNQNAQRRTVIDAFSRSLPCDSCGHMPIGKVGSNPGWSSVPIPSWDRLARSAGRRLSYVFLHFAVRQCRDFSPVFVFCGAGSNEATSVRTIALPLINTYEKAPRAIARFRLFHGISCRRSRRSRRCFVCHRAVEQKTLPSSSLEPHVPTVRELWQLTTTRCGLAFKVFFFVKSSSVMGPTGKHQ